MFELKYGAGALTGDSSLQKHAQDIDDFLGIENNLKTFKNEMAGLFNQKRQLGLLDCDQDLQGFSDERPLLLLTLLNIDLQSWELREVLANSQIMPMLKSTLPLADLMVLDCLTGMFARGSDSQPAVMMSCILITLTRKTAISE